MHALNSRRGSRGMTLIEVLIAIVIFAIGLLGIAALQVAGLRYTKSSQTRVIAAMQAENMADRMRTNSRAVADGDYANPAAMSTDCDTGTCTAAELAAFDTARWLASLRESLGASASDTSVNGTVCLDSTPDDGTAADWNCDNSGDIYAVKIEWLERRIERTTAGGSVTDSYGSDAAVDGFTTNRFVLRVFP